MFGSLNVHWVVGYAEEVKARVRGQPGLPLCLGPCHPECPQSHLKCLGWLGLAFLLDYFPRLLVFIRMERAVSTSYLWECTSKTDNFNIKVQDSCFLEKEHSIARQVKCGRHDTQRQGNTTSPRWKGSVCNQETGELNALCRGKRSQGKPAPSVSQGLPLLLDRYTNTNTHVLQKIAEN